MQKREEAFTVKTYHCRPDGRMKIDALMRRLQEAAAAHAQQAGFSLDWLKEIGCYFVLSNFIVEFGRLPGWNEVVALRTWPSGHNRVITTREFVGCDAGGSELFRVGSEWMVLSRKTNRPRNLAKLDLPLTSEAEKVIPEKVIAGPLERLVPLADYGFTESIRVPYSAVDMNGHVNNTEYVRWGMDVLRRGLDFNSDVRRLQITYLSEVFENDRLDVAVAMAGPGRYAVAGRKADEGTLVYLMEIVC
ncbi:MAG: hypothetical protein IH624_02240 [Phycisphaerae bacterium]|nr:hypothetical protein [Phycisphaerae bacterium]